MAGEWFDVQADGPLFSQRGARALRSVKEFERAATNKVAKAGQRHIRTIGAASFQQPTGHFSARVEVSRISDGHLVHADQVIYGSWLEGTSSKNASSRFKGYALFRRAAQDVQANLSKILSDEENRFVRQLNGGGVRFGPIS